MCHISSICLSHSLICIDYLEIIIKHSVLNHVVEKGCLILKADCLASRVALDEGKRLSYLPFKGTLHRITLPLL